MTEIDWLIRGARVVDGTGNPWFFGDVAVQGDRILDVTPPGLIPPESAAVVADATGLVVCPGFIDLQSHSIISLMRDARSLSKITQGVTTEIMGEGWTPAPFGGRIAEALPGRFVSVHPMPEWEARAVTWQRFGNWLDALTESGVSPNVGSFLGGGTLREYARGMERGAATAEERRVMRRVVAEAMDDGAFGVSYALIYPPDAFVATDELVDVCREVGRRGGVYITHIRSEAAHLLEAIDEAVQIGRLAGVPVEIYHLKAAGRPHWSKMTQVIARIDQVRAAGIDVTADMYPYIASGTGLSSVLPPWVAENNRFFENLRDPAMRARIRAEMLHPSGDWEAMGHETGPTGVMPIGFEKPEHQPYTGRRLDEIAARRGQDWIDTAIDLLAAEEQRIDTIYFGMSEDNLRVQLQQPWMKIATDAGGVDPTWAEAEWGPTHPRAYGTYPRVLAKYVRDEKVLTLEDAIRKMSSAVADRLSLRHRGVLRAGCYADMVLFDPATVGDRATFERPHQLSTGIRDVWINGTQVLADGAHTGATPGRVVRGPGAR